MKGETRYLEMYYHFIATKESLDMLFLKFLFIGPPRLGKTTLRRRLLKDIVDLISAGEAELTHTNTGTVKCSDVVVTGVSNTTSIITELGWSALAGLVQETRMLIQSKMSSVSTTQTSPKSSSQLDYVTKHAQSDVRSSALSEAHQSSPVTSNSQRKGPVEDPVQPSGTYSNQNETRLLQRITESSTILRKAMGSEHWKYVRQVFKAYLRMEDTGGQPELMDMLPALTLGPGLYLLFINLQNDLDHHYKITYCSASGKSTPSVESVYSVKEMLLSSLSSISCSSASSSVRKLTTSSPYMKNMLESSNSVAYIVGTHKDKVSSERIKKLNEGLKEVIVPAQFYKNDLIQFASEEDLIITIDNIKGGEEEIQGVKQILEDSMARHFKNLKIPAVWLFFSLFLRHHDKSTATLEYNCMQLSSTLGMSTHETEVALWFLRHHAGVLMYFPNVPELMDLVILDVQVVYDSVTTLILQSMTYDKVGHSDAKEFKKTGKFTLSRTIAATRKVSQDYIPVSKLVVLLEYLHIIARIFSDHSPPLSSTSQEEVTYMMPCVLRNATKEELHSIFTKSQEVPSLLFYFVCGAVPIGLFPALISGLITTKSFRLIQDKLFKNIVMFRYGQWRTAVALTCHSSFLKLSISTITKNVKLHEECYFIRMEIESTLLKVSSRFNYGSLIDYQLAFECPIHSSSSNRLHLCVIDKDVPLPQVMDCLENADDPHPVKMSDCHKIWFGQSHTKTSISDVQVTNKESSETCCRDEPTFHSLISFKYDNECKSINIINEIGADYYDFGILLLYDYNGKEVEGLVHKHQRDPKCILREIFKLWLEGKGQPVSWQVLVRVLKDVGLTALAEIIHFNTSST